MTLTVQQGVWPRRLNDVELADVARRIAQPMNDDGLRTWYRLDGSALLEEVIALRRERAATMHEFATSPPLEGLDPSVSLVDVANQLARLWREHQQGVWQRAEVKRIRDKLAATSHTLQALEESSVEQAQHIGTLNDVIEQLKAQLEDAISDGRRAVAEVEQACAERSQRAAALLIQAKEILA